MSRVGLAWRLARRDLSSRKAATVIAVVAFAVPAVLSTIAIALITSSPERPSTLPSVVVPKGAVGVARAESLNAIVQDAYGSTRLRDRTSAPALGANSGLATTSNVVDALGGSVEVAEVVTVPAFLVAPSAAADGALISAIDQLAPDFIPGLDVTMGEPAERGIVLASTMADRLQVGLGDTVGLLVNGSEAPVTVVGVVRRGADVAGYVSRDLMTSLTSAGLPPESSLSWYLSGPVSWDDVRALNRYGVVVTSAPLAEEANGASSTLIANGDLLPQTGKAIPELLVALGGLVATILVGGLVFAMSNARLRRSMASWSLLGADRRFLVSVATARGVLVGALAGLIGTTAGALISWLVVARSATLVPPAPQSLALILALPACAVLAGLLAGLIAAVRVSTVSPTEALRVAPRRRRARSRGLPVLLACGGAFTVMVIGAVFGATLLVVVGGLIALLSVAAGGTVVIAAVAAKVASLPMVHAGLRETTRHRSRTAILSFVTAVMIAPAVSLLVYADSANTAAEREYLPSGEPGAAAVLLSPNTASLESFASKGVELEEGLRNLLPGSHIAVQESLAAPTSNGSIDDSANLSVFDETGLLVWQVPLGDVVVPGSDGGFLGYQDDAQATAEAAQGHLVVDSALVPSDGSRTFTARVTSDSDPTGSGGGADLLVVGLPGAREGAAARPLLNVEAADSADLATRVSSLIIRNGDGTSVSERDEDRIRAVALTTMRGSADAYVHVERGYQPSSTAVLAGVATLAAAILAGLTTMLIAMLGVREQQPSLAIFDAVGATSRNLRTYTVAGAAAVVVLPTLAGIAVGLIVGAATVAALAAADPNWALEIPYVSVLGVLVAVPLLAIAGAAVVPARSSHDPRLMGAV